MSFDVCSALAGVPLGVAPDRHTLLAGLLAAALEGLDRPQIGVVSDETEPPASNALARFWPRASVVLLASGDDAQTRHVALAAARPMDLILDTGGGPAPRQRFQSHLLHLRPGGTLVMLVERRGRLRELVDEIQLLRNSSQLSPPIAGKEDRPMPVRDRHALAASMSRLDVVGDFVVAVRGSFPVLAKLREERADEFLRVRPDTGRLLDQVPSRRFASSCTVRTSAAPGHGPELPLAYEVPKLSLRQYVGAVCMHRQVVLHDGVVLPDTYRHHAKKRLRHPELIDWTAEFVKAPSVTPELLRGDYFYLDNQHRGHFGHALTEQISHLWGWQRAVEQFPDIEALVFEWPNHPMREWEYLLLQAGGVPRERIHVATAPVKVESLVAASPMFSMPDFVHPDIEETYRMIGDALEGQGTIESWPERVFCSRRGRRSGHNRVEIEETFVDAGFEVLYPEDLTLGDQVRLVRRAEVLGGFSGSGMFQIAFAGRPKHVILVGSESYTGTNEYMIASVLGHHLDLVLCRPDVPRSGRFSAAAYHSNFTYDPGREGRFLKAVLAAL